MHTCLTDGITLPLTYVRMTWRQERGSKSTGSIAFTSKTAEDGIMLTMAILDQLIGIISYVQRAGGQFTTTVIYMIFTTFYHKFFWTSSNCTVTQ